MYLEQNSLAETYLSRLLSLAIVNENPDSQFWGTRPIKEEAEFYSTCQTLVFKWFSSLSANSSVDHSISPSLSQLIMILFDMAPPICWLLRRFIVWFCTNAILIRLAERCFDSRWHVLLFLTLKWFEFSSLLMWNIKFRLWFWNTFWWHVFIWWLVVGHVRATLWGFLWTCFEKHVSPSRIFWPCDFEWSRWSCRCKSPVHT